MPKVIAFILLLLSSLTVSGQISNIEKIEKLNNKVLRINHEIELKTDSLNILMKEIKHLENQDYLSNLTQRNNGLTILATLKLEGKIRKSNKPHSQILTVVNQGDTVKLTDYIGSYWIVNRGQYFGYLSDVFINQTKEVEAFKGELQWEQEEMRKKGEAEKREIEEAEEKLKIEWQRQFLAKRREEYDKNKEKEKLELEKEKLKYERQVALKLQKQKEYKKKIINKYGSETGQKLLDGYYWIGMTDDMALVSLGNPSRNNKTVGSWGVNEQWVYYNMYLYFKNGILSSYQTSR